MYPFRLSLAQGCWGAILLRASPQLLHGLAGEPVSPDVIKVAHVLGARELIQALITIRRPTQGALQLGAVVEALHAVTMIAAASASLGPRRLTMASAAASGAFALAGVTQSRRLCHQAAAGAVRG